MSVTHSVFLLAKRMPTATRLNEALGEASIDLRLEPKWNTLGDRGFWPAKLQGQDAGFEWLTEAVSDATLDKQVRGRVARFDLRVSLVTRADSNQLASAVAVWGVLASITEGAAYSDESGDFFEPAQALVLARAQHPAPPKTEAPAARVSSPRVLEEPLAVTELRRTSHSLALEGSQRRALVFLDTKAIPLPSVFVVTRRLEDAGGALTVLELEVNRRAIRFTPGGRVLDLEFVPDYSALVRKLGDTESVALAFRKGGPQSAAVLATFIRDGSMDEARRQLAIITLGLMGREASGALAALREMATHPAMGAAATQAIDRIER